MPGLLGYPNRGLLGAPRQMPMQMPMPQQPSPYMMAGQGDGYGSNAWALNTGGPNGLLMRQIVQGIMQSKNPLDIMDPKLAGKFFTKDTIGGLAPMYQDAFKKAKT